MREVVGDVGHTKGSGIDPRRRSGAWKTGVTVGSNKTTPKAPERQPRGSRGNNAEGAAVEEVTKFVSFHRGVGKTGGPARQ